MAARGVLSRIRFWPLMRLLLLVAFVLWLGLNTHIWQVAKFEADRFANSMADMGEDRVLARSQDLADAEVSFDENVPIDEEMMRDLLNKVISEYSPEPGYQRHDQLSPSEYRAIACTVRRAVGLLSRAMAHSESRCFAEVAPNGTTMVRLDERTPSVVYRRMRSPRSSSGYLTSGRFGDILAVSVSPTDTALSFVR